MPLSRRARRLASTWAGLSVLWLQSWTWVLDSFRMALEEADSSAALRASAAQLARYHISDSNRLGVGGGPVDFLAQHRTLHDIGFAGPVLIELVLPHLAPTTPPQTPADWQWLDEEIRRSARCWRALG